MKTAYQDYNQKQGIRFLSLNESLNPASSPTPSFQCGSSYYVGKNHETHDFLPLLPWFQRIMVSENSITWRHLKVAVKTLHQCWHSAQWQHLPLLKPLTEDLGNGKVVSENSLEYSYVLELALQDLETPDIKASLAVECLTADAGLNIKVCSRSVPSMKAIRPPTNCSWELCSCSTYEFGEAQAHE